MQYRGSQGGVLYPRSLGEFQSWFATDADCLDYLEWLRWPGGFVCPRCGNVGGWRVWDGSFKCARCKAQTAVTAGTLFDRRRTPLTVWFQVCWEFATAKDGVSALAVKRTLQIGSYQSAWAMLHRLRSVLIRPGRELLSGQVEVDETYIGGQEAGLAGGRAKGKKALVAIAVEVRSPGGFGRCRMRVIPDGSARTLHTFITDNIAPGSTVITDGWSAYLGIDKVGYPHDRRSQRAAKALGEDIGKLLPECTASRPWPNGGCFPPTKARCTSSTCLLTWTSSASGSTVAAHAAAVWSSTGCSNWPSVTTQSVTSSSLPAPSRRRSGRPLPETEVTRLAWTAPAPDDPGVIRPDETKSAQMDSPKPRNWATFGPADGPGLGGPSPPRAGRVPAG